jgi:prevent-host-death family protein
MLTINISEFRANLLKYLEKAGAGEPIGVTSNGHLLATIVAPLDQATAAQAELQALASTARIHDVLSPISSPWEAQQ